LQQLRQSAAPIFAAARSEAASSALPHRCAPNAMVVAELVDLLRRQCLSAADRFHMSSPGLRSLLEPDSYELLQGHVDNLRFGDAADMLEAVAL
jgi:hypothetical protein